MLKNYLTWRNCSLFLFIINILFCLFIYFKLSPTFTSPISRPASTIAITAPKGKIIAEVPDTEFKYELGLGQRDVLPHGKGMLFYFFSPGNHPMWMKDMRFPIDIVWLDHNKKVVYLKPNIAPDTYKDTEATTYFSPQLNSYYVLELPAGDAEQLGITVGSRLSF